jgi:predicted dehydrogenase
MERMPIPMDHDRPVRLAIIGAGRAVCGIHVPTLLQLAEQYTVTAICSRNLERAHSVAAVIGAPIATVDIDSVLSRDHVDAVLVAMPIHLTGHFVRRSLETGKHVLAEKPLAASVSEARELVDASRRHPDLVTMVVVNTRYAAYTTAIEKTIWEGSIDRSTRSCLSSFHRSH